jgi:hypothetical protein
MVIRVAIPSTLLLGYAYSRSGSGRIPARFVIDETDRVVAEKRLPNDLARILAFLSPCRTKLRASSSNRPITGTGLPMVCRQPASPCTWPTLPRSGSMTDSNTATTRRMHAISPTCCGILPEGHHLATRDTHGARSRTQAAITRAFA